MSPEQAAGHAPDHRVDVYALGVTLYELLTGRVPFEGESFMSVLSKHANKQVPALRDVNPRVKVSTELENVVFRALRKERLERFQHMRDMATALIRTPELPALPFRLSLPPAELRPSGPRPVAEARPSLPAPPPAGVTPAAAPAPVRIDSAILRRGFSVQRGLAMKLGVAAGLLACAAAVYAASGGQGGDKSAPAAAAPAQATTTPAGVDSTDVGTLAAQVAPGEPDSTALDLVTVRVTTNPAGASVRLAGGAEVCTATPCAFQAVRSKPIALEARRGPRLGKAKVNPNGTTDVHLVLGAAAKAKSDAPLARGGVDDLKVPAALFR
jgi:serine/threonine-protein kinase